eukprot:SAG31_NODE_532_length_14374_cov_30.565254_13_plen_94_part_00
MPSLSHGQELSVIMDRIADKYDLHDRHDCQCKERQLMTEQQRWKIWVEDPYESQFNLPPTAQLNVSAGVVEEEVRFDAPDAHKVSCTIHDSFV